MKELASATFVVVAPLTQEIVGFDGGEIDVDRVEVQSNGFQVTV